MNILIAPIKKMIAHFLERFHVVIFVIIITSGLGAIILLLNNIILISSESGDYTSTSNDASFDQATIDRIKQLKTRDEASGQLDLSKGRTNPFVE